MIVSAHSKSYDTSDLPEQSAKLVSSAGSTGHDSSMWQWEDDGGNSNNNYSVMPMPKPTWNVRSLRALLGAILRTKSPEAMRSRKEVSASNHSRRHDDLAESEVSEVDF